MAGIEPAFSMHRMERSMVLSASVLTITKYHQFNTFFSIFLTRQIRSMGLLNWSICIDTIFSVVVIREKLSTRIDVRRWWEGGGCGLD